MPRTPTSPMFWEGARLSPRRVTSESQSKQVSTGQGWPCWPRGGALASPPGTSKCPSMVPGEHLSLLQGPPSGTSVSPPPSQHPRLWVAHTDTQCHILLATEVS